MFSWQTFAWGKPTLSARGAGVLVPGREYLTECYVARYWWNLYRAGTRDRTQLLEDWPHLIWGGPRGLHMYIYIYIYIYIYDVHMYVYV